MKDAPSVFESRRNPGLYRVVIPVIVVVPRGPSPMETSAVVLSPDAPSMSRNRRGEDSRGRDDPATASTSFFDRSSGCLA